MIASTAQHRGSTQIAPGDELEIEMQRQVTGCGRVITATETLLVVVGPDGAAYVGAPVGKLHLGGQTAPQAIAILNEHGLPVVGLQRRTRPPGGLSPDAAELAEMRRRMDQQERLISRLQHQLDLWGDA